MLTTSLLNAKDGAQHVAADGSYRTAATTKGELNSTVSAQWARRPEDQRFTSLDDLYAYKVAERDRSFTVDVDTNEIRVLTRADSASELRLALPTGQVIDPTHFAFSQLCSTIGAHGGYLRKLPARLAGACLQYGLLNYEGRKGPELRAYLRNEDDGNATLRAMTSTSYGRIYDAEVVAAVQRFAGNGVGDTRWKVPGELDWGSGDGFTHRYNPNVVVGKDNTSLFGSDRDVFMFLVDDKNPIEIGTLPNGAPDLVFRGFWVRNSETGAYRYEIAGMLLRGVCCNRNLWGVEGFETLSLVHNGTAPDRFVAENEQALLSYAEASAAPIIEAVKVAKQRVIGATEEAAIEWLTNHGVTKKAALAAAALVREEEQTEMRTLWDATNGLTAHARSIAHNDRRMALESLAGQLFDAAVN